MVRHVAGFLRLPALRWSVWLVGLGSCVGPCAEPLWKANVRPGGDDGAGGLVILLGGALLCLAMMAQERACPKCKTWYPMRSYDTGERFEVEGTRTTSTYSYHFDSLGTSTGHTEHQQEVPYSETVQVVRRRCVLCGYEK